MAESAIRARGPIADADALEALRRGELRVLGRLPWSSNATFLVDVGPAGGPDGELADGPDDGPADRASDEQVDGPADRASDEQVDGPADRASDEQVDGSEGGPADKPPGEPVMQAVYKPGRGERPLHDFPPGLYRREAAAYELSAALGWDLVPPTVVRDGPLGTGSLQLFVLADFEQHYFTLRERPELHPALRRLCAFDVVANATDRKGGHVLLEGGDHVWAIDNGLCFHAAFKLRTVVWDFGGEPLPGDIEGDLRRLCDGGPPEAVTDLLDHAECSALAARAETLLTDGCFPTDPSGRRWPWPVV